MELHEYQAKARLRQFGISVPLGNVITTPEAAEASAREFGAPVVIKAQALTGRRAVVREVRIAHSVEAARVSAQELLSKTFQGWPVGILLIEPYVTIEQELYLSVFLDQSQRCMVLQASAKAGLKATYEHMRETLITETINPVIGLQHYQTIALASGLNLRRIYWKAFTDLCKALYRCARDSDAYLTELTRMGMTSDERFMVLGARMAIDDNALYRQQDLVRKRDTSGELLAEVQARALGIDYIKLDGQIGCVANGSGLAMALGDRVRDRGADSGIQPASVVNIGAGIRTDKLASVLRIILADIDIKALLINVLGAITDLEEIARGIVRAYRETDATIPAVLVLQGRNVDSARQILAHAQIPYITVAPELETAVDLAVAHAKEPQNV